ncbi:hypothetical protein [Pendulispora albinea]|uniref:Uncharacterized protein n=1 Tax=Pendulispora albinea TaxID=2741071 RepID=A0ABZ2M928_9BACT
MIRMGRSYRAQRLSRWGIALFFAVARVLVVVGTVPLSGVVPLVVGMVQGEVTPDLCGDCGGDERGGCDCPTGCPTCHCTHAGVPVVPRTEAMAMDRLPTLSRGTITPYEADIPRSPPPRSVYRPPRA